MRGGAAWLTCVNAGLAPFPEDVGASVSGVPSDAEALAGAALGPTAAASAGSMHVQYRVLPVREFERHRVYPGERIR
jgi:hypothetical protein